MITFLTKYFEDIETFGYARINNDEESNGKRKY